MTHHAAVYVPTGDGRLMWFGLERANGGGFTERDRVMLSLGRQHLANARQVAYARQRLGDETKLDPAIFTEAGFTPRECEVIYWLLEGKSNVEIAVLMKVQTQTIKGHISALFNKTGAGNRLALTLHMLELARSIRWKEPAMYQVPAQPACTSRDGCSAPRWQS
jgi:DNA-binding CsgD family transcriptional regulator